MKILNVYMPESRVIELHLDDQDEVNEVVEIISDAFDDNSGLTKIIDSRSTYWINPLDVSYMSCVEHKKEGSDG